MNSQNRLFKLPNQENKISFDKIIKKSEITKPKKENPGDLNLEIKNLTEKLKCMETKMKDQKIQTNDYQNPTSNSHSNLSPVRDNSIDRNESALLLSFNKDHTSSFTQIRKASPARRNSNLSQQNSAHKVNEKANHLNHLDQEIRDSINQLKRRLNDESITNMSKKSIKVKNKNKNLIKRMRHSREVSLDGDDNSNFDTSYDNYSVDQSQNDQQREFGQGKGKRSISKGKKSSNHSNNSKDSTDGNSEDYRIHKRTGINNEPEQKSTSQQRKMLNDEFSNYTKNKQSNQPKIDQTKNIKIQKSPMRLNISKQQYYSPMRSNKYSEDRIQNSGSRKTLNNKGTTTPIRSKSPMNERLMIKNGKFHQESPYSIKKMNNSYYPSENRSNISASRMTNKSRQINQSLINNEINNLKFTSKLRNKSPLNKSTLQTKYKTNSSNNQKEIKSIQRNNSFINVSIKKKKSKIPLNLNNQSITIEDKQSKFKSESSKRIKLNNENNLSNRKVRKILDESLQEDFVGPTHKVSMIAKEMKKLKKREKKLNDMFVKELKYSALFKGLSTTHI